MTNDILLINSPLYRESTTLTEEYLPPLGLIYIATYLKEHNIQVELLDSVSDKLGIKDIIDYVNLRSPKYIGINIFTINYDYVKEICENIDKSIKIIIGGNLTKFTYEKISFWECSNITIVIGEGEKIVYDILMDSIKEEPFYSFRNTSVYEVNKNSEYFVEDINRLNLDRTFITKRYINHYKEYEESIITSRGCIYNCAYCGSAKSINQHISVRNRSIENIKAEISQIIVINTEVKYIRVLDDLFLKNRASIINAIQLFNNFNYLYWRAMAHIGSFINSLDLLRDLATSGCKELFIGLESGSPRIRSFIHKYGNIDDIIKVLTNILDSGISIKCYFIVGFPTETIEDMTLSYKLAKELKDYSIKSPGDFRVSVFKFRPYHGTELYNYIMQNRTDEIVTEHDNMLDDKRSQFNFTSGNYSEESDEIVNKYVKIIQDLNV
jgi:radical SAM superfamily enzyme YgiQ (UPF0313 family)